MLPTQLEQKEISEINSNDETLSQVEIDRSCPVLTRDHHVHRSVSLGQGDKLHRRNPVTVRQEIPSFDDLIPETTLSELQLNEMPGLQNTEQWKRIASRIVRTSPPLSRQYCQTATCTFDSENGHIPDVLGPYRRPGRVETNQGTPLTTAPSLFRTSRRKILFGVLLISTIVIVLTTVITTVMLVRKPQQTTTDFYSGSVSVQAQFDSVLSSQSSTLSKNYQREFCSLIDTTLAVAKTKYAIFYSACVVNKFRKGSVIGDFTLGFTRYQNVTRLNAFLNRTLANGQLFGGTILWITFNSTTVEVTNSTDYNTDYSDRELVDLFNLSQLSVSTT